jgi:hypothetical protein
MVQPRLAPQGAGLQRNGLLLVRGHAGVETRAKRRVDLFQGVAKNLRDFALREASFPANYGLTPLPGRNR